MIASTLKSQSKMYLEEHSKAGNIRTCTILKIVDGYFLLRVEEGKGKYNSRKNACPSLQQNVFLIKRWVGIFFLVVKINEFFT